MVVLLWEAVISHICIKPRMVVNGRYGRSLQSVSEYAPEKVQSSNHPQLQVRCRATILQSRYTENLLASYSRELCCAFSASVTTKSRVSLPHLTRLFFPGLP